MLSSRRFWAYQASQTHTLAMGRTDKGITPVEGVIYCAGGSGQDWSWQVGGAPTSIPYEIVNRLADQGKRVVSFNTDWTWGNGTAVQRISDLWSYARANHAFASSGVHLVGISMGCAVALNWAYQNPSAVRSLALMLPPVDLTDVQSQGRAATYGLPQPTSAYSGPVPTTYDPARHPSAYSSMPMKLYFTPNDDICAASCAQAFVAGAGATSLALPSVNSLIPGHSVAALDPQDPVDWIKAH